MLLKVLNAGHMSTCSGRCWIAGPESYRFDPRGETLDNLLHVVDAGWIFFYCRDFCTIVQEDTVGDDKDVVHK